MSDALAEALVAAQRRAIGALEKAHVAGHLSGPELLDRLAGIGCTDTVDQTHLLNALATIRDYGAQLPAESKPNGDAPAEPAKATAAQVTFAQSLLQRGEHEPLNERDLRNMPRERISALIEALKAGTYDPTEWQVPF